MNTIVRVLAAASMWLFLLAPAQAQWVTFSINGVADYGRDDLNLFFGEPGEIVFLGGEAFTLSFTFDTADLHVSRTAPLFTDHVGDSVSLTGALSMNGKTYTWTTQSAFATVNLELEPEHNPSGFVRHGVWVDTLSGSQPTTGNLAIAARQELYDQSGTLLAGTGLNQEFAFTRMTNDTAPSYFEAKRFGPSPDITTWFTGIGASATWTVSPVPEPGQAGMLAAGLAVLALARRRRFSRSRSPP